MNQNQNEDNFKQLKSKSYFGVIICQLIHILMIITIIIFTTLSLLNNQNSKQVTQWCTIELTLIIYHLIQLIYEIRNQFYFIDMLFSNSQFLVNEGFDWIKSLLLTRYQSSNIFFLMNDCYIYGLLFSVNFYFRETERIIPGSGREQTITRCDGCIEYEYETIPPQYHGPYLTQLANLNIAYFAFGCLQFLIRLIPILICYMNETQYSYKYNINLMSIEKKSQMLCILFTLYYICRAVHSILIYDQIINETLLCSIQAYIFYSFMMITVLISIIAIIQFKFKRVNYNNSYFMTIIDFIDLTIYQINYLGFYFWILLIASFAYTCVGIHKYKRDTDVDDIVNYQNYVLADLIIAQIVLIFFLLIKYMPPIIQKKIWFIKFIESKYNYILLVQKTLFTDNQEIKLNYQQQYQGECTICLEQFDAIENKTQNIIRLNCFGHHIFHSDCIKIWLQYNKKCPLCKTIIDANLNI